jgi:hypothetical protein
MEVAPTTSKSNLKPEEKEFLKKWCWTAFFFPPVWAFCNQLYIDGITYFIPLYGIFVWIRLAHQGRQMAWDQGEWSSFEQFKKRERLAVRISIALIILFWILNYVATH